MVLKGSLAILFLPLSAKELKENDFDFLKFV
jgi:hypothetical protein